VFQVGGCGEQGSPLNSARCGSGEHGDPGGPLWSSSIGCDGVQRKKGGWKQDATVF